jgi:hypothetical protein
MPEEMTSLNLALNMAAQWCKETGIIEPLKHVVTIKATAEIKDLTIGIEGI